MKKQIYIFFWMVLGVLLSNILHAILEIIYIKIALVRNLPISNNMVFGKGYCALPGLVQIVLPILGIIFGYKAGVYFWQVLYVEKRYRKWKWRK